MSDLTLRVADLRGAEQRFRESAARVDDVALRVDSILRDLDTLALDAGVMASASQVRTGLQTLSGDVLRQFARRLQQAADDIQQAVEQPFRLPHFDLSLLSDATVAAIPMAASAAVVPQTGTWFVATVNRPLYNTWQAAETRLMQTRAQIATLTEQRSTLVSDMAALRNRLLSHDPQTDLNRVPVLRTMQQQAQQIDQEINQHERDAAGLESQIGMLRERLDRVQPAQGADWSVIRQMEQQHTPSYVLDNTYDCVRYVVGRVTIPDGLALNAYQWHDAAANMPQLGVRVGDVPLVGAILQMDPQHSYADDVYGHLMIVERVQGGEVWVTDNFHPDVPVRLSDLTQETSGAHLRYLYLPWYTKG